MRKVGYACGPCVRRVEVWRYGRSEEFVGISDKES